MERAPGLTEEWPHLSSFTEGRVTLPEKPKTPIKEGQSGAFETFRKFAQGKIIAATVEHCSASTLETENAELRGRIKLLELALREANTLILTLRQKRSARD